VIANKARENGQTLLNEVCVHKVDIYGILMFGRWRVESMHSGEDVRGADLVACSLQSGSRSRLQSYCCRSTCCVA